MTEGQIMVSGRAGFAHGLMFHRFHKSDGPPSGQGSLTDAEFESVLNHLGPERILSPQEWRARVTSDSLRPEDLCITFDDGLRSQFDVALPILERYGLSAFWFIFSSVFAGNVDRNEVYNRFATSAYGSFDLFVEDFFQFYSVSREVFESKDYRDFSHNFRSQFPFYTENDLRFRFVRNKLLSRDEFDEVMDGVIKTKGLSVSQIAEDLWLTDQHLRLLVENGHCIGLHSYDHPFSMADLPEEKQREQYARNYDHISEVIRGDVWSMSHPLNSYNAVTIKILSEMGIVCGFRSNITPPLGKAINAHRLELAREDGVNIVKSL